MKDNLNPIVKWIRRNVMSMTYRTEKVTVLRDWKLALMNMSSTWKLGQIIEWDVHG